jgi:hypothetical protein
MPETPKAMSRGGSPWVCRTCGLQYTATETPPDKCKTCLDERQYVGADGQEWTTIEGLVEEGHHNKIQEIEPGLTGIGMEPYFGIGQRAVLVQTSEGNILWDCITVLDQATIEAVEKLGGIQAIVISHPHFYSAMCAWGLRFGAPVYVHEWDKEWVAREDGEVRYWSGDECKLFGGCTVYRLGGHFPGSAILHIPKTQEGKAVALSGDTIQCTKRKNFVSYMYSYPTYIPLPASEVQRIRDRLEQVPHFDKIYGGWWTTQVLENGHQIAVEGAERVLDALEGKYIRSYPYAGYDVAHRH